MRANAGILLIICLLFLIGTVAAVGIPDTLIVTTDKPWIIANNVDQSTITVKVTNTTSPYNGDVQGVTVNLEVDPLYGTLSPTQVTTNLSGMASSTFTVKTKSGAAQINATITAPALSDSTIQDIDHNSAYFAEFNHPMNGTVASEVPFNISLTDQYRNPVDNRRGNHIVNLHVHGPFPDDCGFAEAGYAHDISPILDANGNTSVSVKLTSRIGDNNIAMDGYESIPNQLAWISAEAIGKPFSMTQVYSPSGSPPTLPADGVSYFTIIYNLFDEYGNPTNKQFIWVNTSIPGEERQFLSNNLGQVTVQYGPRTSIGEIDIIATAVANSTVTAGAQRVKFKNTGAEIISLTANPDTMPSEDANPFFLSDVIATVADQSGNAVQGETVNFTIEDITFNSYNLTANPLLLTATAVTDEYGQAAVQFRPGSFTTVGNPGYNATASGQCKVNATWRNSTKIVPLTWKNYPYLSVSTRVTPLTVEINKTIDVTIEFTGDGWALQPTPIDAVMCTDRSGSMLYNGTDGIIDDRMVHAMKAGRIFNANMASSDRVGLVSFGDNSATSGWAELRQGFSHQYGGAQWVSKDNTWTGDNAYITSNYPGNPKNYGTTQYASIDQNLSYTKSMVNASISNMVPAGGTPMREGLYRSVKMLVDDPRLNAISAVVLLTDGAWNTGGNPQGGAGATSFGVVGTGSVITWAKDNNIRIYTIRLGTEASQTELMAYANETGGKYYNAPTADQLDDIYTAIAGDLKDTAGVNATTTADFEYINVTNFEMPGDQVYNYVYHPTESTKINWQDGTTNVTDQSADWVNNNNKLNFTIGTIKVGQSWNATFRLRVNQSGLIDVFGNHSTVSFNGGTEILHLPQTFITVVPNLTVTEIMVKTITLDNLTCTETGEIKALIPVKWNTNYTGNKTLTEKVYYRIDDKGPWVQFDIKTHLYDPLTMEYVDYAQLDVTKLPPGSYQIMVYATASDAPDATKMLNGPVVVGNRGKTYIKLQ
jgi:hypothetical protein